MSITYDSAVIEREADTLYNRAAGAIVVACVVGGLLGMVAGALGAGAMHGGVQEAKEVAAAGALVGIALGWPVGAKQAQRLRFTAQQLLVLVAIERNTRGLGVGK